MPTKTASAATTDTATGTAAAVTSGAADERGPRTLILLGRAINTEFSKIRTLWMTYMVIALAIILPWIITTVVSWLMNVMSTFGEMEQNPEGMLHWTRVLGITIFMVWAVTSVTSDIKYGIFDTTYVALPHFWIILVAKWVSIGSIAFISILVVQPLLLISQRLAFPSITNTWSWGDTETLHFLWAQPVYAFLAVGFAIGMGAIFRTAAAAVGVMLVWEFIGETFLYTTPGGNDVLPWLPFYNASLFAGEFQQVPSPLGQTGAGIYWVILSIVIVLCGVLRMNLHKKKR